MNTLDLHGVLHHKVEIMVEDFIILNDAPVKIITGNSTSMINMVKNVAKKYSLRMSSESDYNLGAYILYD